MSEAYRLFPTPLRHGEPSEICPWPGGTPCCCGGVSNGYARSWFGTGVFQMVFRGDHRLVSCPEAIAERVKMWAFFLFTTLLTAFHLPVVGADLGPGGCLRPDMQKGPQGSTLVHEHGSMGGPSAGSWHSDETRECSGRKAP